MWVGGVRCSMTGCDTCRMRSIVRLVIGVVALAVIAGLLVLLYMLMTEVMTRWMSR